MTHSKRLDKWSFDEGEGELAVPLDMLDVESAHVSFKISPAASRDTQIGAFRLPSFSRYVRLAGRLSG